MTDAELIKAAVATAESREAARNRRELAGRIWAAAWRQYRWDGFSQLVIDAIVDLLEREGL